MAVLRGAETEPTHAWRTSLGLTSVDNLLWTVERKGGGNGGGSAILVGVVGAASATSASASTTIAASSAGAAPWATIAGLRQAQALQKLAGLCAPMRREHAQ